MALFGCTNVKFRCVLVKTTIPSTVQDVIFATKKVAVMRKSRGSCEVHLWQYGNKWKAPGLADGTKKSGQ